MIPFCTYAHLEVTHLIKVVKVHIYILLYWSYNNQNSKRKFGYWDRTRLKEVVSLVSVCPSRMWSTSASWSAATSSTVASTAARTLVTVETVSPAGSPVSPAVIFFTLYWWAKSQKYHIVILPLSLFFSFVVLCLALMCHAVAAQLISCVASWFLLFAGFDELTCHCGLTVLYPPIACGTKPPECKNMCTRRHECDHPGEIKQQMFTLQL